MAESPSRAWIAILILAILILAAFVGGRELLSAQLLARSADLSVSQRGPEEARAGETIVYVMTVTNAAADPAVGVLVGDVIPPGLQFNPGQSDPSCTIESGIVFCGAPAGAGFLLQGEEARSFNVAFTIPQNAGCKIVLYNRVFVESLGTSDPQPGDNASTFTTPVVCGE